MDPAERHLARFGLRPKPGAFEEIRALLADETEREHKSQGDGDTDLMALCCTQIFSVGLFDDVLLIWRAKRASMDANSAVDVQLLCGAGLGETKRHLAGLDTDPARAALTWLQGCEAAGDFKGFTPAEWLRGRARYYGVAL